MLGESTIFATIAVSDLAKAKDFYGTTLGLSLTDENIGGVTFRSGSGKLFVYQAPTAGTNQATCAAWEVTGIEELVDGLRSKGIVFEQYDMPGGTREGDIHIMGPMKAAWFKDPDGNILNVVSMGS
jgi:catechol 2,3-dioxygenase-like lactoylglutathione lyase family enzyme